MVLWRWKCFTSLWKRSGGGALIFIFTPIWWHIIRTVCLPEKYIRLGMVSTTSPVKFASCITLNGCHLRHSWRTPHVCKLPHRFLFYHTISNNSSLRNGLVLQIANPYFGARLFYRKKHLVITGCIKENNGSIDRRVKTLSDLAPC